MKKKYIISFLLYWLPIVIGIIGFYYFENRSLNISLEAQRLSRNLYQLSKDFDKNYKENHKYESFNTVPNEFGITLNGKSYKDIIISYWLLKNTGPRPVSEGDYVAPISINTNSGARLLLVKTVGAKNKDILQNWKLSEDGKFAQYPKILINPEEWIRICVAYQFNPDDENSHYLKWHARMLGLKEIKITDLNQITPVKRLETSIIFHGYEVYILVFFIMSIVSFNIFLAQKMEVISISNAREIIVLLLIAFFGLSTGEILAYSIIRGIKYLSWIVCIPLIIFHILFILYLIKNKLFILRRKW